jgi:hypothetical protein
VRRRMCMSGRVEIVLTEGDLKELCKLAQRTLTRLGLIVERHIEDMGIEDVNMWRSFLDELLMMYISGLLETHRRLLEISIEELCRRYKESDVI